jgi:hypothetical protein
MGSLTGELQPREAAARAEAEELRARIAQLTERLAQAEERPSRLVITRETVEEVLNEPGAETPPAVADGAVPSWSGRLSPIGMLAVPRGRGALQHPRCRRPTAAGDKRQPTVTSHYGSAEAQYPCRASEDPHRLMAPPQPNTGHPRLLSAPRDRCRAGQPGQDPHNSPQLQGSSEGTRW